MAEIPMNDRDRLVLSALIVLFITMFLVCPPRATAQDEVLNDYVQRVWQVQDGLPSFNVQTVAQTPDNYLWLGTTGGLVRFDGESFTVFGPTIDPAFKVESIASLMTARNGDLWIGTGGGGLVRYRHGQFIRYSAGDGFAINFVRSILEDNSGRIWFGTYDGLFYLEDGKPHRFQKAGLPLKPTIFTMTKDRWGAIWIGGEQLIRIYDGTAVVIPAPKDSPRMEIASLAFHENTLWIGGTSGLYRLQLDPKSAPGQMIKAPANVAMIRTLHVFPDGALWIGTIGNGSFSYREGILRRLVMPGPLPSNVIFWIFQDHGNNIWMGSQGGLIRLTPSRVSVLRLSGASKVDFQTLYSDPTGPLWVASSQLFSIEGTKAKEVKFPGIGTAQVSTMLRDQDGSLWIGTNNNGLFHVKNGSLTHYGEKDGLNNGNIRALLQTKDGDIWIGTGSRLNRWHSGKFETLLAKPGGNTPSGLHTLFEDSRGNLWIGADQGLFLWRDGHFVINEATEGHIQSQVWSIFETSDHTLWIGTLEDGLFRWKNHTLTHLNITNNLLPNRIYSILQTKNGKIWFSSPDGIWAIQQNDLDALADGNHFSPPVQFYRTFDGVYSAQLCGGYMHSGVLRSNGDLWFPSLNGPVRIAANQQNLPKNVPPIVLRRVLADGQEKVVMPTINLGTHVAQLELHYGAIDLQPQDELRYRYRMEGFDHQWVNAGVRRVAYYTNLPIGRYIFRVQVYKLDSPGTDSEFSLALIRKPPFYRTWWFYTSCLIFVVSIAWLIYRDRTERLRERFRVVLQERSRVAREMHDTLLRGCTSVSSLLEALWITRAIPDEANSVLLDSARVQMHSTIEEARQAIWGLHQSKMPSADIASLLQEMSTQLEQQFNVPIEYQVLEKPRRIHQEKSHHLLMVTREALFNAARHGNPTKVRLTIHFDKDQIRIEVEDNGIGFTMPYESNPRGRKHYGLSVMRERIESIGGTFDVITEAGHGTRILITAPLGRMPINDDVDILHG
ncbi:ligand-binding sensor domain-containing protein [Edaphobacter dinghuensis]|nr:sensor histidine kinase [Edaphobacter dinghuensis]